MIKKFFTGVAFVLVMIPVILWVIERAPGFSDPEISQFSIEQGKFLVTGNNLRKVEIWAIPTGPSITEKEYRKIGTAEYIISSSTETDQWELPVPADPMVVATIFARGYSRFKSNYIDMALPDSGPAAIYSVLWGEGADTSYGGATTTIAGFITNASSTAHTFDLLSVDGVIRKIFTDNGTGFFDNSSNQKDFSYFKTAMAASISGLQVSNNIMLAANINRADEKEVIGFCVPGGFCPDSVTVDRSGGAVAYPVGALFSLILDSNRFSPNSALCDPAGIISSVSNLSQASAPLFARRFEVNKAGTCTLKDGAFSVLLIAVNDKK
jgi:hypothetical protein